MKSVSDENKNFSCLIVEDNDTDQILLKGFLSKFKIYSESCKTIQEAISILSGEDFDIIFLDLQLEEKNGIEVLKWLRKNNKLENKTVIITSGKKTINDVKEAISLGASDYLIKPLDKEIFNTKIERLKNKINFKEDWFEYWISETDEKSNGSILFNTKIIGINELGISILFPFKLAVNDTLTIKIPFLINKGVDKNVFKIVDVKEYNQLFKLTLNYIGLSESERKTIRLICQEIYRQNKLSSAS